MIRIPKRGYKEWSDLVKGNLNIQLNNFFLRTKVDQIKEDLDRAKLTLEEAISTVYDLCVELSETRDITDDIEAIFGKSDKKIKKIIKEEVADAQPINIEDKIDVSARIERIMQDARKKRNFAQEESFDENLDEANKAGFVHLPEKNNKGTLVLELEPIKKEVSLKKEQLRKASIERRNKQRKIEIESMRNKKGGFLKSIFH